MNINYKLIENERVEDAPFVGALISAIDCDFNCKNCFNQSVKKMPTLIGRHEEMIQTIKSNIFNKGIILAGLEWTLQFDEAYCLAKYAQEQGLLTMLYTGNTFKIMKTQYKYKLEYFDYIKCGTYKEKLKTANHIEYGVSLASTNQHIYKKGIDY